MTVDCFTLLCFLKKLVWFDGGLGLLGFISDFFAWLNWLLVFVVDAVMSMVGLVMASNWEALVIPFSFNISMSIA